jgi:hypothetical protein
VAAVFLVECDPLAVRALTRLLVGLGHQVVGPEEQPDVVVARDTCAALIPSALGRHPRLLLCTGAPPPPHRAADPHLAYPCSVSALQDSLRHLLLRAAPGDSMLALLR